MIPPVLVLVSLAKVDNCSKDSLRKIISNLIEVSTNSQRESSQIKDLLILLFRLKFSTESFQVLNISFESLGKVRISGNFIMIIKFCHLTLDDPVRSELPCNPDSIPSTRTRKQLKNHEKIKFQLKCEINFIL